MSPFSHLPSHKEHISCKVQKSPGKTNWAPPGNPGGAQLPAVS
ncbi:hypothetical protein ATKI12_6361 [Kitasatospora sp. Ki12]